MALDMTCIPTIREELLRLRKGETLHAVNVSLLAHEAAGRNHKSSSARREVARTNGRSHRHWPSKLLHSH